MSETLFAFDERNYQQCQDTFRGDNNQEYYLGDYTIEAGPQIDVRAERKTVGSCSIIQLRSKTRLRFRRTWAHIREDATDVVVLWFVKRGSLNVSHQCGTSTARAGDFVITKSMSPFAIECRPDDNGQHDVVHVVLPTLTFRQYIPQEIKAGFTVPADGREFLIAERMLADVFEDAEELADHIQEKLVDAALYVLTDAIKGCDDLAQERQSLSEKRLQDVMRFIEKHLSDPKLNATMVAEACGISPRYLSHLLRQNGTSFSTLVWDWRLKTAHKWLSSTAPNEISIAEVAFRVGFKSPAHFSRLFKRVYEVCPREFRAQAAPEASNTSNKKDFFIGGPSALQ